MDQDEELPPLSEVARLKAELPGRELHRVEMVSGDDSFVFAMTGPTKAEWKKYRTEVGAAGSDLEKIESAIEKAAIAQIRWPERTKVLEIFNANPGLVQNFASQLASLAKAEVEVHVKKL